MNSPNDHKDQKDTKGRSRSRSRGRQSRSRSRSRSRSSEHTGDEFGHGFTTDFKQVAAHAKDMQDAVNFTVFGDARAGSAHTYDDESCWVVKKN